MKKVIVLERKKERARKKEIHTEKERKKLSM
jgi:hypothetical protein